MLMANSPNRTTDRNKPNCTTATTKPKRLKVLCSDSATAIAVLRDSLSGILYAQWTIRCAMRVLGAGCPAASAETVPRATSAVVIEASAQHRYESEHFARRARRRRNTRSKAARLVRRKHCSGSRKTLTREPTLSVTSIAPLRLRRFARGARRHNDREYWQAVSRVNVAPTGLTDENAQ